MKSMNRFLDAMHRDGVNLSDFEDIHNRWRTDMAAAYKRYADALEGLGLTNMAAEVRETEMFFAKEQ